MNRPRNQARVCAAVLQLQHSISTSSSGTLLLASVRRARMSQARSAAYALQEAYATRLS